MRLEDLDHARLLLERHAKSFRLVAISRNDTAIAATMKRDKKELLFKTFAEVQTYVKRHGVKTKPCSLRGTSAPPDTMLHGVGKSDFTT